MTTKERKALMSLLLYFILDERKHVIENGELQKPRIWDEIKLLSKFVDREKG